MRRLLVALLTMFAASTASAQRSGLLLGFSGDSGYRTLWFAPVDGRIVSLPVAQTLIVPRKDGFHHLDVVRWCEVISDGSGPNSGPWRNVMDQVADEKIGAAPPTPDRANGFMPCDSAARVVAARRDSIARADSIALLTAKTAEDSFPHLHEFAEDESDVCFSRETRITYASSRFWSTLSEEGSGENCDPGRETSSTRRYTADVDSGDASLLKYLPPARARALTRRWEREKGSCALEESPDESWGIDRALGDWRAAFATSGATACAGQSGSEEDGFSIVQRVPPPLARREPIDRWLPQLKSSAANLTDAFASPGGDVVVGRYGDHLVVFVPRGSELGLPALTVAVGANERVVMAEWATGAFVDRWTAQLRAVNERW